MDTTNLGAVPPALGHPTAAAGKAGYVLRFSPWARFQHLAVIFTFTALAVTGLPQKWPGYDLSRWLVEAMGGIYATRYYHRVAGIVFSLLVVAHLTVVIVGILSRRMKPTMLFTRQDFRDAIDSLNYYLGRTEAAPRFGRYDYRQKFEYWGLVFGGLLMVVTGLILLFPIPLSQVLPAQLIPAAKVAHSFEALMAFLVVLVWHLYGAHLNPEVFPWDNTIWSGKISVERLHHEHPLEYEEMFRDR
jgi:formate dehydrogenase subunit gamma